MPRPLEAIHRIADDGIESVLDYITDCVMAGMARSGEVYDITLPDELLQRAFQNTARLLKSQVQVVEPEVKKLSITAYFGEGQEE